MPTRWEIGKIGVLLTFAWISKTLLVEREAEADFSGAIYRTSSIGDVVLATACLDALAKLPQRVHVYWFGRHPVLGLLQSAYPQVTCIEVKRDEGISVSNRYSEQIAKIDFILDLQKNLRSRLICTAIARSHDAKVTTWQKKGIERTSLILRARLLGRGKAAPLTIQTPKKLQYQMMLAALQHALDKKEVPQLHQSIEAAVPTLPISIQEQQRPWQKELRFGTWIAVAPGAAHPTKKAPTELFVEILSQLRALLQNGDQSQALPGIVFLGDDKDREVSVRMLDQLGWPVATLNLAGKLSLWESALALSQVKVLLSNDSSLLHISEAVGTPVAVLFGPTVEAFGFAPRMSESKAFSSLLGCRPCSKHGKVECRYHDQLCFASIAPHSVSAFLQARVTTASET